MLFGREMLNWIVVTAPFYVMTIFGFFSYAAVKVIDSEEAVREAYFLLNWYEAPLASQKLYLLAIQQPTEVRIGGFFSYDQLSLTRFVDVLHNAYDFGLILFKLSK